MSKEFISRGDEIYKPRLAQPGKDVIWVPTPSKLIAQTLEVAKVNENDLLFDLGAGDGYAVIAAARDHNARAVGIEFNPDMAALARRNVERAGVSDRVTIINGDILQEDFTQATVIFMNLRPELNRRLQPTLSRMQPGTRVISIGYALEGCEPSDSVTADGATGYVWVVT